MISSRCSGRFDSYDLSDVRRQLQADLETVQIFGKQLAKVFLSEDFAPGAATQASWDNCLELIDQAHLTLVLYNGQSGSRRAPSAQVGICHEEFRYAYERAPERVRLVVLGDMPDASTLNDPADRAFRNELPRPYAPRTRTYAQLLGAAKSAISDAILRNFTAGLAASRRDSFGQGRALDWTRMDYANRATVMRAALASALKGSEPFEVGGRAAVVRDVRGRPVLCICHAVPAAMSIGAARELFGQPFLRDFETAKALRDHEAIGPLHLVACHRGVTEQQAIQQLGFPDATIVPKRFGVYVADDTQGIQILFLEECRTETAIRDQVDAALEWLDEVGEDQLLVQRAELRKQIVELVDTTRAGWQISHP
jgi:hypothetical protein